MTRRLLLIFCSLSILIAFSDILSAAEAPDIVLMRVPPGWTASEEGYFLNANALSSLTAAAKTYRLERDEWEKAYFELSRNTTEQTKILQSQISDIKSQLDIERDSWKKLIKRSRSPGFGIFAGAGYTGDSIQAVVGVGFVWRIL